MQQNDISSNNLNNFSYITLIIVIIQSTIRAWKSLKIWYFVLIAGALG